MRIRRCRLNGLFVCACLLAAFQAAAAPLSEAQQRARDIYQQLVDINTTQSAGDTYEAARAMAARLTEAGVPAADVHVYQAAPKRGDLIARVRGSGKRRPILLMAHLDVVEAKAADWSTDPFRLVEKDGWFYGRGSADDKFMAATFVATLGRLVREGYRPDRDLILVLETDEEISDENGYGIQYVIRNHRDLIGAEYALNEGGGVGLKNGRPVWNAVQTSEKVYASFWLETRNKGGHSSQPRSDNAIYELARALGRIAEFRFPVELNETTRQYFRQMADIEQGETAADMKAILRPRPDPAALARLSAQPPYNAQLRTTCVATRLEGGHADNALPQRARALVNCRILPGVPEEQVRDTLVRVVADPGVTFSSTNEFHPSPPSPLNRELIATIERVSPRFWPGVPVLPMMSAGATDGLFMRNAGIPTYGHSGLASDIFDVRAHGKDERVSVQAFYQGQEYWYQLLKALSS